MNFAGSYTSISIIALCCYTILFFTFIAVKKNRIINSFLLVLLAMIMWTGGSLFMRMDLLHLTKFWYDVSLTGLLLLAYAFFNFVCSFVGEKTIFSFIWFAGTIVVSAINIATGVFLKVPDMVMNNGVTVFIYNMTWTVAIPFALTGCFVIHMFYIMIKYSMNNAVIKKQLAPVLTGILVIFFGNVALLIPWLKGFPIDILSGIFNAFIMFYALYRRRIFKMTLLVSHGTCYVLAGMMGVFLFYKIMPDMGAFLVEHFAALEGYTEIILAVLFLIATVIIYYLVRNFLEHVFVREEIAQAECLKEFSTNVSKSLKIDSILDEIITVIQKVIPVKRVYLYIADAGSGDFRIAQSSSQLEQKNLAIQKENPIALWFKQHNECILMRSFRQTVMYKCMWETEKQQLKALEIECLVPLKDNDELVGIILLTGKNKNKGFTVEDLNFLDSVNSIGSIAVKNSRLYQKVYDEARTDDLTGLLNRKYFFEVLNEEYEQSKGHPLALLILNIDDFKLYNQLYGTKEGDLALQRIAKIIRASVGGGGYVARYSGKEFAVILPGFDVLAARNLAESIRTQIRDLNSNSQEYSMKMLTVSAGICAIPYSASNVKQLVENADMAVYQVKRNGKNAVMIHSMGMVDAYKSDSENTEKKSIYSEYETTINALTAAIDTKDHYTFSHSQNVAYYATEIARAYGLNEDCIEIVREAGVLHDIGKIGIPEAILNKPGKLTDSEYEIMKGHVENSIGIIRYLPSLDYVIPAVIGHHERYDGRGYPRGIAGEDIPMFARILCVADSFDAMVSKRSYKASIPVERALQILREEEGKQFDPQFSRLLARLVKEGRIKVRQDTISVESNSTA